MSVAITSHTPTSQYEPSLTPSEARWGRGCPRPKCPTILTVQGEEWRTPESTDLIFPKWQSEAHAAAASVSTPTGAEVIVAHARNVRLICSCLPKS